MPSNSSVDLWREAPRWVPDVGVLPSGSPRGIPRRVVMSRDSPGSECDGAKEHKDLDRFRPPEHKTLRPVWWFVFP